MRGRRQGRRRHCLSLCWLFGVVLWTAGSSPATAAVRLDSSTREISLGKRVEYLEDKSRKLTLEQVRSAARSGDFAPSPKPVPNFGYSDSVFWFRVELHSNADHRREWLLEVGYPMLDRIELYTQQRDGRFARRLAGDHFPFHQREIKHRNFVFSLWLDAGQRQWVYIRIVTYSSVQVPLTLYSPKAFLAQDHEVQAALWLFYGIMLVMVLYNFFIFLSIRDRTYGYYVLYMLGSMSFQMSLNGLTFEYVWPNAVWWANICVPFLLGFAVMAASQFARSFLATREHFPRLDKILIAWLGVGVVGMLLSLFGPYRWAIQWTVLGVSSMVVLIMISAGYATRRGFRPARYLLIAWAVFTAGVFLHSMKSFGLMPSAFITTYGNNLGSALEAMLLSFALADRINVLKTEAAEAQTRALESERRSVEVEREAKENLQAEVDRQTEALREANLQLQAVDREKTRFFQNISHELRSPLTVILNPIEGLIASGHEGPPQLHLQGKLQAMERNTHRLLRLVNQLLDFARLESGQASLAFEKRDLVAFLEPIVDSFQIFAATRELTLDLRAPADLPAVYVDPEKLDTVVCNLLSNACKFTPGGGTVLVRVSAGETHLRVAVKDNGVGIPEDQLGRIFERYGQVEAASYQEYQGTGIGLALARELTAVAGGTLDVESEMGFGSTFTVRLPLGMEHIVDSETVRAPAPTEEVTRPRGARMAVGALSAEMGVGGPERSETAAPEDGDGPLVLVVEDNADMRALVAEICREHFAVHTEADGEAALEWLETRGDAALPVLIVSDVMMPRMDGHELLTRLRTERRTAGIPVMLLTAKAGPERRIEGLESGADDYLTKPFDARELSARIRNIVRLREQERQVLGLNDQLARLNARLEREVVDQTQRAERARELGRYLPPGVVDAVLAEGSAEGREEEALAPARRRITLFRLELRGLAGLTDVLEPEELAEVLNSYLGVVMRLGFEHGATLTTTSLERVAGFLGAPRSLGVEQDALAGARLAVALHDEVVALAARWEQELECAAVDPAVVLHSGYATVGNFGEDRLEYAAVSGVVHEANALALQAGAGVLCSQATWTLMDQPDLGAPCGEVRLRTHGEPVRVYRLAGKGPDYSAVETPRGALTPEGRTPSESLHGAAPLLSMFANLELREGVVIAERYETRERIGGGGMGTVYRARDRKLDLDVALKLIRPDLAADAPRLKRLRQEVTLSRKITHRNVARIYDIGEWPGGEFISMEYLAGRTLEERLAQDGPLPGPQLRDALRQICAGLAAAHEVNVIHRDLKPSNVMEVEAGRLVLLDFGIARAASAGDQRRSDTREFIGTPHYMAPEQVRGAEVDHRADLYSVGAVAYEMATGKTLFEGDTLVALAFKHATETPPDPRSLVPELDDALAALILRCLEKDPAQRFATAVELFEALKRDGA